VIYYDKTGSRIYRPLQHRTPRPDSPPGNKHPNCGVSDGHPEDHPTIGRTPGDGTRE
jgi:hypothetical protein